LSLAGQHDAAGSAEYLEDSKIAQLLGEPLNVVQRQIRIPVKLRLKPTSGIVSNRVADRFEAKLHW
jgi:hypothetical protein